MQVRQINVAPGGGTARFRIPSSYPYVTVMNNSDYTIEVQADGETVFTMPLYTILTLPIGVAFRGNDKSVNYDFIYSGGVTTTTIDILFNEYYMPLNQTLSTPGGGGMVIIAAQAAGMATELKQDATIAALAAASTAANQATGNGLLTDIRDTAGIKKITDQLPAGTNNIGDVDVLTLPALPAGSNLIGKITVNDGVEDLAINTDGSINIKVAPQSGTVQAGLKSVISTATALYASSLVLDDVLIQADPVNTDNLLIGNSAYQGVVLEPGQSISFSKVDLATIYAVAVSGTLKIFFVGVSV